MDEDEDAYNDRRNRERASEIRSPVWTLMFAAAVSRGGTDAKAAVQIADLGLAAFDSRFVRPVEGESDEDD